MKFMELKNCPHCDTRVLPTSDDLCPNCRHLLHDVTGIQVEIDGGDLPQEKQGLKKDAKCPICGLINPAGTIICDCGYDFDTGSSKGCSVAHLTTLDIIICVFFPLIGIIIGIIRSVQKKNTAGQMISLSLLAIVVGILLVILKYYLLPI